MERPHSNSLRAGRASIAGHYYLLTACTDNRLPHFAQIELARMLISELHSCDLEQLSKTYCYVVMPDHFHWLLMLKQGSLAKLMQRVKARTSRKARRLLGEVCIWQSGYHDRMVRHNEDLRMLARYVVANPLRRGLVKSLGDYPHWDAIWLPWSGSAIDGILCC